MPLNHPLIALLVFCAVSSAHTTRTALQIGFFQGFAGQTLETSPIRFGAACDGIQDDTAGMQAAINALGPGGGVIRLSNCRIGALSWPNLNQTLVLQVYNKLTLTAPLVMPTNLSIVGGGQAQAIITGPGGSVPAIVATHTNLLQNVRINTSGIGVYIDGTHQVASTIYLDKVTIWVSGDATPASVPLVIDAAFNVWIRDCTFLARDKGFPASIRITTSNIKYSVAGLIFIDSSEIAGYGIQVDAQKPVNLQGHLYLNNIDYEAGRNALLTVDSSNGIVDAISIRASLVADPISVPFIIREVGASPKGIQNVSIDSPALTSDIPIANAVINHLKFLSDFEAVNTSQGWTYGEPQRRYVTMRQGSIDADWAGNGASMAPGLAYSQTLAVEQDTRQWQSLVTAGTLKADVIAPDGSATAGTLIAPSGTAQLVAFNSQLSPPLRVGDWIVGGVWIKSDDQTKPTGQPSIRLIPAAGNTFDNVDSMAGSSNTNTINLNNDLSHEKGAPWSYTVGYAKISSLAGSPSLVFLLAADASHPTSYWMPWMMRVPSGTLPDLEVIRLARYLRSTPGRMPSGGGIAAFFPHQKLYWGNDTNLYRNGPGRLKTDGSLEAGSFIGNASSASKATALASKPAVCPPGKFAAGIDVFGNAVGCSVEGEADHQPTAPMGSASRWKKYAVEFANGCWWVNGVESACGAARTKQNIPIVQLDPNYQIEGLRLQATKPCVGPRITGCTVSIGVASSPEFFSPRLDVLGESALNRAFATGILPPYNISGDAIVIGVTTEGASVSAISRLDLSIWIRSTVLE